MSRRLELGLALALALAVAVAFVAGSRGASAPPLDFRTSSLVSGPQGSRAVYDVLARLRVPVERRRSALFDFARDTTHRAPPAVLLVLDPPRGLYPAELAQVMRFVRSGGRVVGAGSGGERGVGRIPSGVRAGTIDGGGATRLARGNAGRLGDPPARRRASGGARGDGGAVRPAPPGRRDPPPVAPRAPGGAGRRARERRGRRHRSGAHRVRAAPPARPHGSAAPRRTAVLARGARTRAAQRGGTRRRAPAATAHHPTRRP